jgi:hypothetical protein
MPKRCRSTGPYSAGRQSHPAAVALEIDFPRLAWLKSTTAQEYCRRLSDGSPWAACLQVVKGRAARAVVVYELGPAQEWRWREGMEYRHCEGRAPALRPVSVWFS